MGRSRRISAGGVVYHVLNRANARLSIFSDEADYAAFEKVLAEAVQRTDMRLLAYILMPNHWHLVLWPRRDGQLSAFVRWLTLTHTQRWHAFRDSAGSGHLYQGRFKSFPVQEDQHLRVLCRYVERNALRAGLVRRAEDWRWCSLWQRQSGDARSRQMLSNWPTDPGLDWLRYVNKPRTDAELDAVRTCIARGRPLGASPWQQTIARRLSLQSTLLPLGRPKNARITATLRNGS